MALQREDLAVIDGQNGRLLPPGWQNREILAEEVRKETCVKRNSSSEDNDEEEYWGIKSFVAGYVPFTTNHGTTINIMRLWMRLRHRWGLS